MSGVSGADAPGGGAHDIHRLEEAVLQLDQAIHRIETKGRYPYRKPDRGPIAGIWRRVKRRNA